METKWKPTLLSSPPGWLPNWTSATKVQISFTDHTSDIGEVTGQSQRVRFCKIMHSRRFSLSPPQKKNFPLPPLGDICSMARYTFQWSWTSWDTCHPALSLVHPQDVTSPSNFQVLQVSNSSKTNGNEDHLRVPPWFLLRVQRIQRWDLSMDEGFASFKMILKKQAIPSLPKFQCQVAMNFFHFPRSINASR